MAERKPENITPIITTKQELDKAAQERMRLSQVYCRCTDSMVVSSAASA
jgi:hypothetical protein